MFFHDGQGECDGPLSENNTLDVDKYSDSDLMAMSVCIKTRKETFVSIIMFEQEAFVTRGPFPEESRP